MLRILRIGEPIVVNMNWSTKTRTGVVTEISLQTMAGDPAGESGRQVDALDLDLDRGGSISYKTENGEEYWAYLTQIDRKESSRERLKNVG